MKRGRPKGYNPYIEISYAELGEWVGQKGKVQVSKKWFDFLSGDSEDMPIDDVKEQDSSSDRTSIDAPKIEYSITTFNNE